ncbi:MAG TPA: hypothetical protein ENI23_12465 [bacterium]|nr:hypothetical protein [bacterium]
MRTLLILVLLFVPFIAQGSFDRNLFYGISNDLEVTKLQEFLTTEGVYDGPVTGNFFSLTLQGVKNFQAREGISPVAGYFGPLTRTRANEILNVDLTASEQQAILETGAVPVVPEREGNINDVFVSVNTQIGLVLRQIELLQAQIEEIKALQNQVAQQTQVIEQIQQNTTPPPTPEPVVEQAPTPIEPIPVVEPVPEPEPIGTPIVFSNIKSLIVSDWFDISWNVDNPSSISLQRIHYSTNKSLYTYATVYLGASSRMGSIRISRLKVDTTYYFRILAIDKDGNEWFSDINSFRTD